MSPESQSHMPEIPGKQGFTVALVDNEVMENRWNDVEAALRVAFQDAEYLDEGYDVTNPIGYTRAGIEGRLGPGMQHALALGTNAEILGGIFCIPMQRQKDQTDCEVGWVFLMPDVKKDARAHIMDTLMGTMFDSLAEMGFQRIVTNMGTRAGAKALTRYGVVHEPRPGKPNRWVKDFHQPQA